MSSAGSSVSATSGDSLEATAESGAESISKLDDVNDRATPKARAFKSSDAASGTLVPGEFDVAAPGDAASAKAISFDGM